MKTRKDSFFGLHFDHHAYPYHGQQGTDLKEEDIRWICRTLKPDFIQIDSKGHPGWASYATKLGNALPHCMDTLALWRRVTEEEGVALYLHHSGVFDAKYCEEHPEEEQIDHTGKAYTGSTRNDGKYVDELLIPQMSEIVENYHVDGFWVDGEAWATYTDFHPETLEKFQKETGIDLQGRLPATPEDPYYQEYRDYAREMFRRYVRHYVDEMHKRHPGVQITSNWIFSDLMPEPVTANVDYLSGDLRPENSVNSARYAARALAQQEMPWDLMSWNFRCKTGLAEGDVVKHPVQVLQEAASVICVGGAFQNYIMQFKTGEPNMYQVKNMTALAEFMHARKPFCFRGKPVREAAMFLSDYNMRMECEQLWLRTNWERAMGVTAAVCDSGYSLGIISEHRLDWLSDYKVILVPELKFELEQSTMEKLLDFARNGGNLVLFGKNTCKMFAKHGVPFTVTDLEEYYPEGTIPHECGLPTNPDRLYPKTYYLTYDENKLESSAIFRPATIQCDGEVLGLVQLDVREAGEPIAVRVPFGAGSVCAAAFDLGSQYVESRQYTHRELLRRMLNGVYTPAVKLEHVTGLLEIMDLDVNGKQMIQLVNVGGSHFAINCATEDYIPPVLDIELSIALPKAPEKLILQPEGRELPFEYRDGRAYVKVDRVDIHSIIEVVEQ